MFLLVRGGQVITDEEAAWAALGFFVMASFAVLCALRPDWRRRGNARWGRRRGAAPMSAVGCGAWALLFLMCAVVLAAQWVGAPTLGGYSGTLMAIGFFSVVAAAAYDSFHSGR